MGRFIFVSFGLLVVFLSLSGTGADCPSGWYTYEGHCYQIFHLFMTWKEAERFCTKQAKGGHLVSIESAGEADFVAKIVADNMRRTIPYIWMGLRRVQSKEKQCSTKWSDGSSVSYENWSVAEFRTCLGLEEDTNYHKWANIYCGKRNPFLCKAKDPAV